MREILFRGKSTGNKEWIKDGEWVEGLPMYTANKSEKGKIDRILTLRDGYYSILLVDPETVCQYTEKIDDNDEQIWEEDFVRINNEWIGRITWKDDVTAFCVLPNDDIDHETYCLGYYIEEGDKVEVIGNVFDNPELVERGKANEQ